MTWAASGVASGSTSHWSISPSHSAMKTVIALLARAAESPAKPLPTPTARYRRAQRCRGLRFGGRQALTRPVVRGDLRGVTAVPD